MQFARMRTIKRIKDQGRMWSVDYPPSPPFLKALELLGGFYPQSTVEITIYCCHLITAGNEFILFYFTTDGRRHFRFWETVRFRVFLTHQRAQIYRAFMGQQKKDHCNECWTSKMVRNLTVVPKWA